MPGDTARECTVIMLDGTSFSVSIKVEKYNVQVIGGCVYSCT